MIGLWVQSVLIIDHAPNKPLLRVMEFARDQVHSKERLKGLIVVDEAIAKLIFKQL
jgi:hypothetical protein